MTVKEIPASLGGNIVAGVQYGMISIWVSAGIPLALSKAVVVTVSELFVLSVMA